MAKKPFHILPAIILCLTLVPLLYLVPLAFVRLPDTVAYIHLVGICGTAWVVLLGIYRLAFHPLAKYPGPLLGALTNWYTISWLIDGKRHLNLYRQHERYGKFLRYSPSRLSINSAEASEQLNDVKANTVKSDFYSVAKVIFGAEMSMTTPDFKKHAFKRRVNLASLSPAAVKEYSSRMTPHVDCLVDQISTDIDLSSQEGGWGSSQDASDQMAYCIADMMTTMTFGDSWNTLKDTKHRNVVKNSALGSAGLHLAGHVQWMVHLNLFPLFFPKFVHGAQQIMGAAQSWAKWRENNKPLHRDIWANLLEAIDPDTGKPFTPQELVAEAALFMTGGTDNTTTALCATLFYLASDPHAMERVTKEIRGMFPQVGQGQPCPVQYGSKDLQGATYLLACIDESMRLTPPFLSILPRTVGRGGILVDGEYFPEGVTIGIPIYVMHRDARIFPEPHRYVPERWLPAERAQGREDGTVPCTGDESINMRAGAGLARGFIPFGAGRYSCIGRQLAYDEMSYILARILWLFDIRLAPEYAIRKTPKGFQHRDDEFRTLDRCVSTQDGPILQYKYRTDLR